MEDLINDDNITSQEYVKFLHIAISHIDDLVVRTDMIEHLGEIKDQLQFFENCYQLKAYEPQKRI